MWTWLFPVALAAAPTDAARDAYLAATVTLVDVVDAEDTAVWTFHKQERVDHDLQPRQSLLIKYRRNGDTYLRYVGDVNEGREVLYRPDVLPGEILVNPAPLLPTVTFDLGGRLATDGERYSVDNLDLHKTVARYRSDGVLLAAHGHAGMEVTDLGRRQAGGEAARCWLVVLPTDAVSGLYADRVETCVADRTRTLVSMKAWERHGDGLVLIEDYVWADLQLGAPLSDEDFSPDNPAYGF